MADLLECLVQIHALREAPRRLAALAASPALPLWQWRPARETWAPVEVLAHLADIELLHGVRVRAMLTLERPPLPVLGQEALATRAGYLEWPVALALARFTGRRTENLELLDACTASDLERMGVHPRRGSITVADLVALMLAHDTAHVGQIRQRLEAAGAASTHPEE